MIKYFISFLLVLNCLLLAKYEDNSPALTTKEDLKILQNFENLIYHNTDIDEFKCNQLKILTFININKVEKIDYNKLLIKINAQINNSDNYSDSEGTLKDRDRANIQLTATYPLYDKKTDIDIKKRKIKFRENLITEISKYCENKNNLDILQRKIDLLNLKQLRSKVREDTGQIYLDDRITLIEKIIEKKNELSKLNIENISLKLILLNKVKEDKQSELKELL